MSERINRRADQPAETIHSPEARAIVDETTSIDEQIAALEARRAEMKAEADRADAWGTSDPIMTFDTDGTRTDFDDYLKMRTDAENAVNEEPTFEDVDYKSLSLMQLVGEGRKMNELSDIAGKDDVFNAIQDQLAERAVAEDWTEEELSFQVDRFSGLIDADVSKPTVTEVAAVEAAPAQDDTEQSADVTSALQFGIDKGLIDASFLEAINSDAKIIMPEVTPEPTHEEPMTTTTGERLYSEAEADALLTAAREASDARALALLDAEPEGEVLSVDSTLDTEEVSSGQDSGDELLNEVDAGEVSPERTDLLNAIKMSLTAGISALALRLNKYREQKRSSRENETDDDREKRVTGNKKKALGLLAIVGVAAGIGGPTVDRLQNEYHDTTGDNVASAPQSIENANNDILAKVNTPEVSAEHVTVVTPETLSVDVAPGGGWYKVMEDMDIPDSERKALLNKVGPELFNQGYADVDTATGEYRIVSSGQLPADVLKLIQSNR